MLCDLEQRKFPLEQWGIHSSIIFIYLFITDSHWLVISCHSLYSILTLSSSNDFFQGSSVSSQITFVIGQSTPFLSPSHPALHIFAPPFVTPSIHLSSPLFMHSFNPFLQSSIYPDHSLCSSPLPSVHMLINSLSIYPSILFIHSIHPIHQSAIYPSNKSFVLSVPKSLYLADFSFVYSSIHASLNPLILSVNHQLVRLFLPLIILLSIHLSVCPYSCLVRQSFIWVRSSWIFVSGDLLWCTINIVLWRKCRNKQ